MYSSSMTPYLIQRRIFGRSRSSRRVSFRGIASLLMAMVLLTGTCALSNPKPSKYYRYKTFRRLSLMAPAYSVFSKVASRILQFRPQQVPTANMLSTMTRRKVALVTGSNTGVGYETAKSLVQDHGYEVILACRSVEKGVEACQTINAKAFASRGRAIFVQAVDLANFTSVEAFVEAVNQQYDTIDVLVNNAGRNSAGDVGESDLCPVFATNFLGHFLLTRRLLDKCQRVVNVASVMHHFPLGDEMDNIDQVDFWKRVARGQLPKTYGPSKLAALLFSLELNRRFGKSKGIRAIAVNPGAVNSDIWRNYPKAMQYLYRLLYLTSKQGATTSVAAAVIESLDESTVYLQPYLLPRVRNESPPFPLFEMLGPYAGYVETTPRLPEDGGLQACQSLFQVCEEITGVSFDSSARASDESS